MPACWLRNVAWLTRYESGAAVPGQSQAFPLAATRAAGVANQAKLCVVSSPSVTCLLHNARTHPPFFRRIPTRKLPTPSQVEAEKNKEKPADELVTALLIGPGRYSMQCNGTNQPEHEGTK